MTHTDTIARCGSCTRRILWARSAKTSKWIPLDHDDVDAGTRGALVLVNGWAYGPETLAQKMSAAQSIHLDRARLLVHEDWPWHLAHFATCPNADKHRRKK